jgi:hypothetical protein
MFRFNQPQVTITGQGNTPPVEEKFWLDKAYGGAKEEVGKYARSELAHDLKKLGPISKGALATLATAGVLGAGYHAVKAIPKLKKAVRNKVIMDKVKEYGPAAALTGIGGLGAYHLLKKRSEDNQQYSEEDAIVRRFEMEYDIKRSMGGSGKKGTADLKNQLPPVAVGQRSPTKGEKGVKKVFNAGPSKVKQGVKNAILTALGITAAGVATPFAIAGHHLMGKNKKGMQDAFEKGIHHGVNQTGKQWLSGPGLTKLGVGGLGGAALVSGMQDNRRDNQY